MKMRIQTTSKRLLATLLLAQLGVVVTREAAAQSAPPVVTTPADASMPPASASPVAVPQESALAAPVGVAAPPVEPVRAAELGSPGTEPAQGETSVLPPALGVAITPAEPLEPASTAQSSGSLDRETRFRSSDADIVTGEKPLFKVGDYRVRASGYVQAQYQSFQQSRNAISPDGVTLLNLSGFAVPRARALIEGSNDWSSLVLEYDLANLNAAGTGVQRAEATLVWRNPESPIPYLAGTIGVFRTPFGFEAARSARDRLFAENATITQAFFPGQSDVGARLEGGVSWFRYAVAFVNGHPINEPRWGGRAPTKQGDILGRLGVDASIGRVRLVGGASLLKGKGFTAGTAPSKDTITVRDVTEQGALTPASVTLVPARSATDSRTFERWGTGVDLELSAQIVDAWRLWVRGEFMFGQNLDRGLFISNPLAFDGRGYGAVTAIESLLFQVGLLGVRYDFYEPNPDNVSNVAGSTVKVPQRISTTSALAGFQLPNTRTRLFAQYDRVKDHLALGLDGRPTDFKNDRFTLRLQVSLW